VISLEARVSYLKLVCDRFEKWWQPYAFIEEIDENTWFEFGLKIKTPAQSFPSSETGEANKEILRPVLEVLDEYPNQKLLIAGIPGAGKSTLMARMLLKLAHRAQENLSVPIPVLVELRSYHSRDGIWVLIQTSLEECDLYLEVSEIKKLVAEKQLILLIDGLNELSEESARNELDKLCRRSILLIVATRELSRNLSIERKLEIQPLSPSEVETFLLERLPTYDRARVRELCDRVRDFGQTPLMVWMLYSVFSQKGEIPQTRGEAYRAFTTLYAERAKAGIDLDESRFLLSKLAFAMMQSQTSTEFRLEMTEIEVQNLLESKKVSDHLICNHLLQWEGKPGNRRVRFCHQSLQEYYAAEMLLLMFQQQHPDTIDDERFQHFYLNYLKWTEVVAIFFGLPEVTEAQGERLVKSALEADLRLGARFAGAVNEKFQSRTINLILKRNVLEQVKVKLLGQTGTQFVLEALATSINSLDYDVCLASISALLRIPSKDSALVLKEKLVKFKHKSQQQRKFSNQDIDIYTAIIQALSYLAPEEAIKEIRSEDDNSLVDTLHLFGGLHFLLGRLSGVQCLPELRVYSLSSESSVRQQAAEVLGEIDEENSIKLLQSMLEDTSTRVRQSAILALIRLKRTELTIQQLVRDVSDEKARDWASKKLVELNHRDSIPLLLDLLRSFTEPSSLHAAWILSYLGYDDALPYLLERLNHENYTVRRGASVALGQLKRPEAIPELEKALRHYLFAPDRDISIARYEGDDEIFIQGADINELSNLGKLGLHWTWAYEIHSSRMRIADALLKIGTHDAINVLVGALASWHPSQIEVAIALTQYGRDEGIPILLSHVKTPNASFMEESVTALSTAALTRPEILPDLFSLAEVDRYTVLRNFTLTLGRLFDDLSLLRKFNILERLKELNLKCPDDYIDYAIAAIQNRCQFYNYEIFQKQLPLLSNQQINGQSGGVVNNNFNIGTLNAGSGAVNLGGTIQGNQVGTQNNYASDPKVIEALAEILKQIQQKHPQAQQTPDVIDVEFEEIRRDQPQRWQTIMDLLSVAFAGGVEAIKIVAPQIGIPIEVAKRLYEIYDRNRKSLPGD
jgi:HEAT repeat protein